MSLKTAKPKQWRVKQTKSDERVNRNPGADMIVMGKYQILRTEKNFDLFSFSSKDRVICLTWRFAHVTEKTAHWKSRRNGYNVKVGGNPFSFEWWWLRVTVGVGNKQQWMEINYWNLIKKKIIDNIRPIGNRKKEWLYKPIFSPKPDRRQKRDR